MTRFSFHQVDVFTAQPTSGNPLAVVGGADGLSESQMAAFARWTNLSETTFLLRPEDERADYRVRIFTPFGELPFAGHPTLGSCHVWLAAGGVPKGAEIVQECAVGPVRIRRDAGRLFFAAPPLKRAGPAADEERAQAAAALGLAAEAVVAAHWVDNGPGWLALLLRSRADVLAVDPDFAALGDGKIGIVGPWDGARDGAEAQFEVRAFFGPGIEDPVTGSLNAGLAQWLIGAGLAPARYVASQGTALGRRGRVHVLKDGADIWIGGDVAPCVEGTVIL
ncbi:MAG: PhzF family phenazine biosynthesis protein [Pseudochelatococcus sp.]|uniref:PhzF family phenazine biosynthesis protein n=1 Tax=Pseudochelatococcus sp. TaxID=2020869 RepID=UPI003D8C4B3E